MVSQSDIIGAGFKPETNNLMSSISNSDSVGETVFIVTITTFVIATTFVVARLVSRFGVLRSRTADDWSMILAWVSLALR